MDARIRLGWQSTTRHRNRGLIRAVEKSERGENSPIPTKTPGSVKSKCIVAFVDTSQQAYGAAVYSGASIITMPSHLSAAKSKVAPLTPMTVPRLELMGTILGRCLTHSLLTVLEVLHPPYKMASSGVTGVSRSQSSFPTTPNVQSFCLADPGWQNWLWRIVMREEIVPLEKTSFFASWVRDFGSSPHVRRSANGTMNLMNARKDGTSQLVRLWYHSRRQGNGLLSSPSPKQPWIFQVLCIPFKDTENLDRKGGCASLTCYEARAVHL